MNVACLFEYNSARARVQSFDVEIVESGNLREPLRLGVKGPNIGDAVTILDEINCITHPGRIDVF